MWRLLLVFWKAREDGLEEFRGDNYLDKTDSLSLLIKYEDNPDLIWERANIFFANDDFNNAESDYLKCLEINPNHVQSLLFLGWINEKRENYKKAIELYEMVLNYTGKQEIILFIEHANGKAHR